MDNQQCPTFPRTHTAGDDWRSSTASSMEALSARGSTLSVNSSRFSHVSSVFSTGAQRDSVASTNTDGSSHPRSSTASMTSASFPAAVPDEHHHLPVHQGSTPDSSTLTTTSTRTSTAKQKDDNKFKCLHCDETFSKATDQKKHLKDSCQSLGAGYGAYRCLTCPCLSMTRAQATTHQKKDHPKRPMKDGFREVGLPGKRRFTCCQHRHIFPTLEEYTTHADHPYSKCVTIGNHDHRFRLQTLLEEGKSTSCAPHTGIYMDMVVYWQSWGWGHIPENLLQLLTDTYTNHKAQTLADKLEWGVVDNQYLNRAGRAYRSVQELMDKVVCPLVFQYTAFNNESLSNTQHWLQSQDGHDSLAVNSLPGSIAAAPATSAFTANASNHSFISGNTRSGTGSDSAKLIQSQCWTSAPLDFGLSSAPEVADTPPIRHLGSEASNLSVLDSDNGTTFIPIQPWSSAPSKLPDNTEAPGMSWPVRDDSLLFRSQVTKGFQPTGSTTPPSSRLTSSLYLLPTGSMAQQSLAPQ